MSIDPNIFSSPGSVPGITSALMDLDRRVSAMETARTFIGSGTIEGGPDGHIVAASITSAEINTGSLAAESALIDFLSAGTIETKSIVASTADIDKLHADTIAAHTITAAQIAAGTITATEIAANTITATNIAAGTLTATEILAGSITGDRLAAHTITSAYITAGTITATEIASHAITAAQIAAGTITATEIATGTITTSLMTAGTINADRLSAGTITSGLLATNSVTSAAIVSGAVTSTKISVSQLSAIAADMGTITAGTITGATLRTASSGKRVVIDSTGITAYGGTGTTVVLNFDTTTGNLALLGTVTASSSSIIPATTINASGGGIVSGQIQDATIVGADIAANTITANNIVAATITATELATDSVTSVKILARTIQAGDIATGTLTANEIQAGSITADRLSVTDLTAITSNFTTLTSGTITGALIRTASSGARIEVQGSSNAIKTYDSTGTQIQQIDAVEGVAFLAPTLIGGANKQSLRWTTSIGGTEAAKVWAYNISGQSAIDVKSQTTTLSTQALASLSAYNFAGHQNKLEITAISNNAGGEIKAWVRNSADTADLVTTIINNNGDMSINRNLAVPNGTFNVGGQTAVTNAVAIAVKNGGGNSLEFGHSNSAGYRGTLGAQNNAGKNFLAFHAEHGTNNDTFRTRGQIGSVMYAENLDGGVTFGKIASSNADNQTPTVLMRLDGASGNLTIGGAGGNVAVKTAFTQNITGTFGNFFAIANTETVLVSAFNQAGGGTYWSGFVYYDTTNGMMVSSNGGNNITLQYSGGQIQIRSTNGVSYTMRCVLIRFQ